MKVIDYLNAMITETEARIAAQENGVLRLNEEIRQKQELLQLNRGALGQMKADLMEQRRRLAEMAQEKESLCQSKCG